MVVKQGGVPTRPVLFFYALAASRTPRGRQRKTLPGDQTLAYGGQIIDGKSTLLREVAFCATIILVQYL